MFEIITDYHVAIDSPDHLNPYGCVLNSSMNKNFNKRLYEIFNKKIIVLDLGCAGGGFVYDCIHDGYLAIGLEGSDEPVKRNLGNWPGLYNKNLFTCDVAKPFKIHYNKKHCIFDVITAWELLEHIHKNNIDQFLKNVVSHLNRKGLFIVSVNTASKAHSDEIYGRDWGPSDLFPEKHFHHQNVEEISWWDRKFAEFGLYDNKNLRQSFGNEFIRGPGHGADGCATEERMNISNLPVKLQWATINRVLELR